VVDSIPCVEGTGAIQFEAEGGQSPYTYSWNPSSIGNTSLADNLNAGDYFLTVSDINGCNFETSFSLIDASPFSASISSMDLSCDASNDGQISIFDISGGQAPYTFTINNQPTDSTTISGLSIGVYNIDISDANNCLISFTEELIASNNSIFASYTENYTILQGDSVNIESTLEVGNFDFEWINNNQTLSCTDCANPTASPSSTTVYDLIITDESGCTQSISVLVEVEIVEIVDVVPNIFSPNGDNRNDEFRFLSNDPLTVGLEMSIFDRWGNLVFRSQSVGNEITWDGTKNGNELNNGVFVYRLIIQSNDGTSKSLIGDVLLLR
jgi:gliding motility-associated-like protein